MKDYIEIGSSPVEEDCAQVGCEDYSRKARIECNQYIAALRAKFGPEPDGARLYIKGNPHDFGTYYEVNCEYDDDLPESAEYAFKCEGEGPLTWAEVGMEAPVFDPVKIAGQEAMEALDRSQQMFTVGGLLDHKKRNGY